MVIDDGQTTNTIRTRAHREVIKQDTPSQNKNPPLDSYFSLHDLEDHFIASCEPFMTAPNMLASSQELPSATVREPPD